MALPRTYDALFRRRCPQLPTAYLRALAKNESDFRTGLTTQNCCWGLLQVHRRAILPGFNKAHGTSISDSQLLNPEINVAIACWHLNRVLELYKANPTVRPNWSSRRWVELFTFGWNAGHSRKAGVLHVVNRLERALGWIPSLLVPWHVNIDEVHSASFRIPTATKQLQNTNKVAFSKRVARMYFEG